MNNMPAPSVQDIADIIMRHSGVEGALLPLLHEIQSEFGHVPDAAISPIAEALNISGAEVHGVVSFYHDFRKVSAGRHVVKICRAEACQSVGAKSLAQSAMTRLGVTWHGTTPNGAVTIEPVYCLGLCACGPAAMVDGKLYGRVDEARLDEILVEAGA